METNSLTKPAFATNYGQSTDVAHLNLRPNEPAPLGEYESAIRRRYRALLIAFDAWPLPRTDLAANKMISELFYLLLAGIPVGIVGMSRARRQRADIFALMHKVFEKNEVTVPARDHLKTFLHFIPYNGNRPFLLDAFVQQVREHHVGLSDLRKAQVASIAGGAIHDALIDRKSGFYVGTYNRTLQKGVPLAKILGVSGWQASRWLVRHLLFSQRNANPRIVLLAAPSGAGKTTLARKVIAAHPRRYTFLVRATVRPPRCLEPEQDADEHEFLTTEEFTDQAARGQLAFTRMTYGLMYGISIKELERLLRWDGLILTTAYRTAHQLCATWPESALHQVGIIPPCGHNQVRARILNRDPSIQPAELSRRLKDFKRDVDRVQQKSHFLIKNAEPSDLTPACSALVRFLQRIHKPPNAKVSLVAYLRTASLGCGWTNGRDREGWPHKEVAWQELIDPHLPAGKLSAQLAGELADAIAACVSSVAVNNVLRLILLVPNADNFTTSGVSIPQILSKDCSLLQDIRRALVIRYGWRFGRRRLEQLSFSMVVDLAPEEWIPGSLLTARRHLLSGRT